jgi:two-component system cell cycle sensor histidine kinase/response regulator CckA
MTGSTILSSVKRALGERAAQRGPLRALVVDDEETVRKFVSRVLIEAGYQTLVAEDGRSAIGTAEKEAPFDILVTDLMMPNMSGDELARRLRQTQSGLKVLYLTGYSDKLFKDKVTLWEDEAFLDKPCGVKGLLEAVSLLSIGTTRQPSSAAV